MRASSAATYLVLPFTLLAPIAAARAPVQESSTVTEATPENFVAKSHFHRVLVRPGDAALDWLTARDAVVWAEDYGGFQLVLVDSRRTGGLAGLQALGVEIRDELTLVDLNGYLLDGADELVTAGTLASIPGELRAPIAPPADGERRLRIVQFTGPVKDEWYDELAATGAFVVTYVANDAYVVSAQDPEINARVENLRVRSHVLSVTSYESAFKLRPELRPPVVVDTEFYPVTVQVIGDEEGRAFAETLFQRAIQVLAAPDPVLNYVNVGLLMDGANVMDLARDPRVFAIEPIHPAELLDERQGQIQAGNLDATGTQASAPTYISWLASKGFPGANPFPFSVDVTDDGVDRGSTTDVNDEFRVDGLTGGASRLAFNFNYSGDPLADGRAGHGNINASIIGGYRTATGTAFEDSLAYQYGLGIAPWVRLGNSKVFNNAGAGVFNQPTLTRMANAYNAGARVSSNSWGFTSGTTYNSESQAHDTAVRDAVSGTGGNQELTIVFAAGNSGPGASTVHPPGTAKNIITAGAGENWRPTGTDGCGFGNTSADNAKDMASFSSRGPTSDSRKKPDICSPGTHVQGAASRATGYDGSGVCNQYFPSGQTLYCWSSGTSHSTPAVSGACALVRQWFTNNGLGTPSPAMVKAHLMNSASYMTGSGANDTLWSNNQGMGRTNLGMAFDGVARIQVDQSQLLAATGATYTTTGNISTSGQPFRVTLAWSDVPGPTTGNAFVNNLDLEVTVNGTLYRGNVFTGGSSSTGGTADLRNNVESVFLPSGTSGAISVTVRATNVAGDGVPGNGDATDQDFALVVYNATPGVPQQDFSLSASPTSRTITAGGSTSYTVSNTPQNGFSGNISLTASPAIGGVTYSFVPNPMTAGGSSTFNVTTTAGATTGTHTVTITGTSGALVHTTNVTLVINPPGGGGNAVKTFSASPNLSIPDNNATGVTSTINVPDSLTVGSVAVGTTITHPYKGDLVVTLTGPDGTSAILHNRSGGSADNVTTTFAIVTAPAQSLGAFGGKNTAGAWTVKVQDLAAADLGTFNAWTITFNGEQSLSPNLAIPDNNATGVTSTMNYAQTGTVAGVKVRVNITHTYKGDLEVSLIAPDGTSVLLHNRTGGSADNVNTEFPDLTAPAQSLAAFTGKAINGAWKLKIRDLAALDTGTLVSWTLSLQAQ